MRKAERTKWNAITVKDNASMAEHAISLRINYYYFFENYIFVA